jgi:hypothetical protein
LLDQRRKELGMHAAAMKNPETNCACLFAFFIRGVEY